MRAYVVRPGDYLQKLAHVLGFDAVAVWDDPKNAALKAQRDPDLLSPGDVLYLPDSAPMGLAVVAGAKNKYVAAVPKTQVLLCFRSEAGPLADEPCVIQGIGGEQERPTSGEGEIVVEVPVHLRELQIFFPERGFVHPVRIGDMDPIDVPSGVRKRLQNGGHHHGQSTEDDDAKDDELDRRALLSFQRAEGLEPSGLLDEETKAALVKAHGS
ncbi:MAG: peptidoglycan-binding domain-containing protein [Minicystis sp.]